MEFGDHQELKDQVDSIALCSINETLFELTPISINPLKEKPQVRDLAFRLNVHTKTPMAQLYMLIFGPDFPEIRLRVSEELYVAQLQKLRGQEVDVTVGGVPGDLPAGELVVEPLMKTVMVPTVRKGSPWMKARTLADLQSARWVFTGTTGELGYAKLLFERHGLTPPPVGAVVNSTLALMSLVARATTSP